MLIVFFWENFGPTHLDRICAVANRISNARVVGVEFRDKSDTYDWEVGEATFEKLTLFKKGSEPNIFLRIFGMLQGRIKLGRGIYVLCHYDWIDVFIYSIILRISGCRVYTMLDSKFDDKPRFVTRELVKSIFLWPYNGAIVPSKRSAGYLEFLGLDGARIYHDYDTLSVERMRGLANISEPPTGTGYNDRDFICIARLVPKKNHRMLLHAYSKYVESAKFPRKLHLCGNGPLEGDLKKLTLELGLRELVVFHGFLQSKDVSLVLSKGLCLLLPSTEEQFGLVVIEAMALGLPVLVSDNCGARDNLVRNGINGFVIEADNPDGLAFFMEMLADDKELWLRLSASAYESAKLGDATRFAESVSRLIGVV